MEWMSQGDDRDRSKQPTKLWLALWRDGNISLVSGKDASAAKRALEEAGESYNCLIQQYDRHICLTFRPEMPEFKVNKGLSFETPGPPDLKEHFTADMKRLMHDEASSDVQVHCGNCVFKCHSFILSLRCDFFRAAFASGLSETREKVVRIDHLEEDVLQVILTFIYTGNLDFSSWDSFDGKVLSDADERMMKMIRLGEAADFLLLPHLRDAVHHEISLLPEPWHHDCLKALVNIQRPHASLQQQIFLWVHWYLRNKRLDSDLQQDDLYSMLSEEFKSNLAEFVKFKLKTEPFYGSRLCKLANWLSSESPLPGYEEFTSQVESVHDLHTVSALHKLCRKWDSEGDEQQNGCVLRLANYMVSEMGFDLGLRDERGDLALHCAVEACAEPLVTLVMGANQDYVGIMNNELETPCDVAMKLRLREDVDSTIAKRIQQLMLSAAGDNLTSRMPDWLAEDQEENFRELYENYANMKFEWLPSSGFNAHVMFADFFNFSFPEFNAALKRKNDALMHSHSMVTEEELISALKEDVYFRLARIARPQFDIFASCCWKQEEEAAEDRSGYSA